MGFTPTQEQQEIITEAESGKNLVIQAGAGSGKTSTLRLIGDALAPKRGLYAAYNRTTAKDAEDEFPANVTCKTAHSLAMGAVGHAYKHRIPRINRQATMPFKQQARLMGITSSFPITDELSLSPPQQVSIVKDAIAQFCNSDDTKILPKHIWKVEGAEDNMDKVRTYILPIAQRVWADGRDRNGKLPITDDYYLKMWALGNPNLRVDFVLYDEAQDANPCIAGVVLSQRHYGAQVIMVGDSAQAIYGWRGAIDAMSDFERTEGVKMLTLSQSFRFGPAIAAEANKWLGLINAPLRLKGFEKVTSTVTMLDDPDAILCRTNAECIRQALLWQDRGKRVAIVGGTAEIKRMAKAAADLQAGRQPFYAEFAAFRTWEDFCSHVEDEGDGTLKVFVKLVNEYGPDRIISIADATVKQESDADVVVSTAHKAKGREWDSVLIAGDFREPSREEGQELSRPEMMLAYVAVTRARKTLDNAGLAWVDAWLPQAAREAAQDLRDVADELDAVADEVEDV